MNSLEINLKKEQIMKNLQDYNNFYIKKVGEYFATEHKIRQEIKDLEEEMNRLIFPSFEKVFIPIIKLIKKELKADGYEIFGPFGLSCETTIYWLKDVQKEITVKNNILGSLTIISNGDGWMVRNTSQTINKFNKRTIGEVNGGNYVSLEINEKMDIEWLLKFIKTQ